MLKKSWVITRLAKETAMLNHFLWNTTIKDFSVEYQQALEATSKTYKECNGTMEVSRRSALKIWRLSQI